ncbi:MAG: pyridoxamine 5'-phosphate oxidase [Ginsengibacter sp.]
MPINTDIASIRKEYQQYSLDENEVDADPIPQFAKWWKAATESKIVEPNAMTLATCSAAGAPSARIVLLKTFTNKGFIFFTNYESRKGAEIQENPKAALIFFWKELERQVRIEGTVSKISEDDSDEYFASRPNGSKIGAWSSPQSKVIIYRDILDENVKQFETRFANGNTIDRPPYWGGYIVEPKMMEFWQGRPSRLHDRIRYSAEKTGWKIERLAP